MKIYTAQDKKILVDMFGELRKRDQYAELARRLGSKGPDKVTILYGLRRTGKSVMLAHALTDMSEDDFDRTLYIDCQDGDDFTALTTIMGEYKEKAYKYFLLMKSRKPVVLSTDRPY